MNLPRISVVTPAYQSSDTIESTMLSVLNQGYPNLEYILVDGGSTDGTADIVRKYEDRLAYWVSEPDKGQYDAVVKGFEKATGDVFYWINSDDLMLSDTLKIVGEIFSRLPNIEWLSTLRPIVFDQSGAMAAIHPIPGFSREAFLRGRYLPGGTLFHGFIQQESTFFTPDLWRKASHALTKYPLAGDFALWCEMYRHAELTSCQYPLCGFRARAGQRSLDMDQYLKEANAALDILRSNLAWRGPGLVEKLIAMSPSRKVQRLLLRALMTSTFKVVVNDDLRADRSWIWESRVASL